MAKEATIFRCLQNVYQWEPSGSIWLALLSSFHRKLNGNGRGSFIIHPRREQLWSKTLVKNYLKIWTIVHFSKKKKKRIILIINFKLWMSSAYIGCFYSANGPNGPSAHVADNDLTVESCIRFCNSRGFPFAGMQVNDF